MCSTNVSLPSTLTTSAGLISTITVGILPPAKVLTGDLIKATLREGSPNLLQMAMKGVGKQTTSETTDSRSMGEQGVTKGNQVSSSKPGVLTAHSSAPGSGSGAAGDSGQDPNKQRQGVSHLALVINDDEFTDDPHQIIPTEDAFALPFLAMQGMEGLIGVTFYQQRSLHFEESTTTSQVRSGLASLVHLPGISFWIIKNTWPQNSTQV